MLTGTLENNLVEYIQREDIEGANNLLMSELANKLVDNRLDFIELLNSNDIEADESMPKSQLIELFIDNTDDKKLLVGASLLANQSSKDNMSNFDNENISDDSVKNGVAVMDTYFNDTQPDEEYSYIAPFLLGALAKGAKKLIQNRTGGQSKGAQDEYRRLAEQRMKEQAALRQRAELERRQRELEASKKRKKTNTILIVSGGIVISLLVGIIIYNQR